MSWQILSAPAPGRVRGDRSKMDAQTLAWSQIGKRVRVCEPIDSRPVSDRKAHESL